MALYDDLPSLPENIRIHALTETNRHLNVRSRSAGRTLVAVVSRCLHRIGQVLPHRAFLEVAVRDCASGSRGDELGVFCKDTTVVAGLGLLPFCQAGCDFLRGDIECDGVFDPIDRD